MRAAILAALQRFGELTYSELAMCLEDELAGKFSGSVKWYCVSVKQDLEARGILKAWPKTRPLRWYIERSA